MKVVFSDDDIAVIIKPPWVSSQSMPDGHGVPDILKSQMNCMIYPVHRLDAATSGLMVYAKSKRAASEISRDIVTGCFYKEYIALVHGVPSPKVGEYEDLLYHDVVKNRSFVVQRERKSVRRALLTYETVNTVNTESGDVSIVRIYPKTGRTHQIRVQFATREMPLVGDKKYGAKDNENRLALCCRRLDFKHPTTGEDLTFIIPSSEIEILDSVRKKPSAAAEKQRADEN